MNSKRVARLRILVKAGLKHTIERLTINYTTIIDYRLLLLLLLLLLLIYVYTLEYYGINL